MENNKFYLYILSAILIIVISFFMVNNTSSEEKHRVKAFYPEAKQIHLVKSVQDDLYISLNFPGIKRAYEVDGAISTFVVSSIGYNGPIELLVAIEDGEVKEVEILEHEETQDYAKYIEEDWFLKRFQNIVTEKYLNLVVLDKEKEEDIIQVTGATVSSLAVVNGVNAAIGAYQYLNNGIKMARVPDVVPQEMWGKDENSFAINWDGGSIRIDLEEIKTYEQLETDAVLINTTGTEANFHVKGPTLETILKGEGINISDYEGIGITGRDGYYTLIDKEKFELNPVILGWEFDRKLIKEEEKPVRIVFPNEMGPYWVKMVTSIDLYKDITPKAIEKVHIFEPLTADIEPYYYEYYGSKDKSIEIGKILMKFDEVDPKGFFTMASVDGLIKNETISLVRQRYFIKVEGDNAPMNIAPKFKLGMNVKEITHFSTTKDAVIFPEKMKEVVRTIGIDGEEGLLLEDVLLVAGMRLEAKEEILAVSAKGNTYTFSSDRLAYCYIVEKDGFVSLYDEGVSQLENLLRIEKYED